MAHASFQKHGGIAEFEFDSQPVFRRHLRLVNVTPKWSLPGRVAPSYRFAAEDCALRMTSTNCCCEATPSLANTEAR